MAHLLPTKLSSNYIDPRVHNSNAELAIIEMISNLDKEKTKDWYFLYSFSFKSKNFNSFRQNVYKDCEIDFLCLILSCLLIC